MEIWRVLNVNPEPWVVPFFAVARPRHSKKPIAIATPNQQLVAFQSAVKEAIDEMELLTGELKVTFYFWRQLAVYVGINKKVTKNTVDATNMQKSTEDALQGVVFANDREVKDIRSVIVDQGVDAVGRIVIKVEPFQGLNPDEIPSYIWDEIDKQPDLFGETIPLTDWINAPQDTNDWPPR